MGGEDLWGSMEIPLTGCMQYESFVPDHLELGTGSASRARASGRACACQEAWASDQTPSLRLNEGPLRNQLCGSDVGRDGGE